MNNEMLIELSCLYYEVHTRFYTLTIDEYFGAMSELSNMADSLGYTINDLAKIVTYA